MSSLIYTISKQPVAGNLFIPYHFQAIFMKPRWLHGYSLEMIRYKQQPATSYYDISIKGCRGCKGCMEQNKRVQGVGGPPNLKKKLFQSFTLLTFFVFTLLTYFGGNPLAFLSSFYKKIKVFLSSGGRPRPRPGGLGLGSCSDQYRESFFFRRAALGFFKLEPHALNSRGPWHKQINTQHTHSRCLRIQ